MGSEQCEAASARPDSPPPLDAFNAELKAYVQRQVELEDADLSKTPLSVKSRDKSYYSGPGNPYDTPMYAGSNRSTTTRTGRYNAKLDGTNEHGFSTSKSSRPQSRDCRLHSTDKPRECDKSGLIDSEYSRDSGAENSLFDEDRKLNVFVNNSELDELIVKAIQVLRIHLLELHKVNELCKDFCSRYIHSLKTKFQSDPLIHGKCIHFVLTGWLAGWLANHAVQKCSSSRCVGNSWTPFAIRFRIN
ncbi:unnamed protein product [Echinostoma caproni]|uniref:Meis_PKNOX_N domain-containing protein n=1 Tax=Echinostoma caproni TaxID=27848 RepID=A0A183B2Y9_9TREM|nr:unnamed protein product [Echinostoma caproni]